MNEDALMIDLEASRRYGLANNCYNYVILKYKYIITV